MFPLTLDGNAQKWYQRLPRGSIKTFEQMCRKFAEQFREVVALEDDMMELSGVKQGENETLKEFLKR